MNFLVYKKKKIIVYNYKRFANLGHFGQSANGQNGQNGQKILWPWPISNSTLAANFSHRPKNPLAAANFQHCPNLYRECSCENFNYYGITDETSCGDYICPLRTPLTSNRCLRKHKVKFIRKIV